MQLISNLLHFYTSTSCKAHFTNTKIHIIFIKASEKVRQGFSRLLRTYLDHSAGEGQKWGSKPDLSAAGVRYPMPWSFPLSLLPTDTIVLPSLSMGKVEGQSS